MLKDNPEVKPKIAIADSQFLAVDSLIRLIESEGRYGICGIVDNRKSLLELLNSETTDLLITDYNLIDYESPEDFKFIIEGFKDLSILIITNQITPAELEKLMKSGIRNISLKTDDKKDLLSSIEMAMSHKRYFSEQVLEMIIGINENKGTPSEAPNLTYSEIEIIKLIAEGYTTKEIAIKRHISTHTVMTHRKNIFRKLEINNVSELIRFAVRKSLIDYTDYII
jgi:DNA-binding NarL/FixJ family response regulator